MKVRVGAALLAVMAIAGCTAAGPSVSAPPDAVTVTAQNDTFTTGVVTAPAGAPFTIYFNNKDASQHNVHLWRGDTSVAATEIFGGPGARTLDVLALDAGSYRITCDVHPSMHATLAIR